MIDEAEMEDKIRERWNWTQAVDRISKLSVK